MHVLKLLAGLATVAVPGWQPIPVPQEGSDLLSCGNYSEKRTVVSHDGTIADPVNGRALPSPAPLPFDVSKLDLRPNGRRYVHAVQDGWLVGINHGEFGAALWWISSDAQCQRKIKVPRELKQAAMPGWENPAGFADYEGDTFLMTGLDHLSTGLGRMFRVVPQGDTWGLNEVARFEGVPEDWFENANGALVVLTHRGLYTYAAGSTRRLATFDLSMVRPLTIGAHESGGYIIGTRLFLVVLHPQDDSLQQQWYLPAACPEPKLDMNHLRCRCEP